MCVAHGRAGLRVAAQPTHRYGVVVRRGARLGGALATLGAAVLIGTLAMSAPTNRREGDCGRCGHRQRLPGVSSGRTSGLHHRSVEVLQPRMHLLRRLDTTSRTASPSTTSGGVQWGDAGQWVGAAEAVGISVTSSPAVGSVAWTDVGSALGHVAWVANVHSDGTIDVEEYDYDEVATTCATTSLVDVRAVHPHQGHRCDEPRPERCRGGSERRRSRRGVRDGP